MSKEAIIFSIDAGNAMDQKFIDSESSRLKIALQCLKLTLQQKLFNNSSHQIGFTLFGQDDSDDGNNTLLMPIDKPDLQFVRKVVQLSQISLGNQKPGGDIFSSIQFMIDVLIDHCKKKKYNKRAFIFTNGRGKTKASLNDLRKFARIISQNDIKINIIPMDFMQTYDFEINQIDEEMFADPIQKNNTQMLLRFKSECPQNIQIFPASLAIELYKKFRKRDTNPVALFKGKFKIAPNVAIDVCSYKAIRNKFDLNAPFDPEITKQKEIQVDVNYIIEGDTTGTIIDKDKVMNAYQYGNNIIPMDQLIENAAKIFQQRNFTLLGFVKSEKIPRHCFLGQVDLVVPQKEDINGRKLFSALIYSTLIQKKYVLARYVPRNSKKGVTPRLIVLIPFRNNERQMFYLIQLPTNQCCRDYPFNSLKQSIPKQKQIISELVDKMLLVRNQDGLQKQDVKTQNLFNPYRQYFYQTLFYRALNSEQKNQIPPLDQVVKKYMSPQVKIYENTKITMEKLKQKFKLKVNELKREKQKDKKVVIWRDVLQHNKDQAQIQQQSTWIQSVGQQVGKKFTLDTQDDDSFNHNSPILSFKKMINNNKKDLVMKALKDMDNYIYQQIKHLTQEKISCLVQCVREMRNACLQQKQVQFWDNWFDEAKNTLSQKLFQTLKTNGIGYIIKSNQEVFKVSSIELKAIIVNQFEQLD